MQIDKRWQPVYNKYSEKMKKVGLGCLTRNR